MDADRILASLASGDHANAVAHVERIPERAGIIGRVPLPPELSVRLKRIGIDALWSHQADGLEHARAGRNVAIATGTASGKSLVYQLATFERLIAEPRATAIYLYPTKALAQDQLRHVRSFALPAARASVYDGDTPAGERRWVQQNANILITNPDMLHVGILPQHQRWALFMRNLAVVVIDEMHVFRGMFGSHVGNVLRRLRRIAAHYGASPLFVAASATIGNPAELAEGLTATPFEAVTSDGSPRGERVFAFWNPPFHEPTGIEQPARLSATAETAGLLAGLVRSGAGTLAFARSRRGAELIASHARDLLGTEHADLARRVATYRAGYLPEERRALERALSSGELLGVAATSALELGIDIGGLDACVLAGYPGTIAATWQQAGRAGRSRDRSLVVLVAQDDPLDQYIVSHPEHLFGSNAEAAVIDHANPNIFDDHLAAAAYEMPITDTDAAIFGSTLSAATERLVHAGRLRVRGARLFYEGRGSPAAAIDIRSAGRIVSIVEHDTGRLLGTSEGSRALHTLHRGAIYLHQGEQFEVTQLDVDTGVALVRDVDALYYTHARDVTDIRIAGVRDERRDGDLRLFFGSVVVSNQVTSFVRKRLYSNEIIDEEPLDLPEQTLVTDAVWYTVPPPVLARARLADADVPGAAHAAEHCAIGIMPLFAMCDRWDIGGVSTALHPDTGLCTVFIYDGYPGGAGFARRSFLAGTEHVRATMETIDACPCADGCPSCVQSPKCGNGNNPLDKSGAARLLRALLS